MKGTNPQNNGSGDSWTSGSQGVEPSVQGDENQGGNSSSRRATTLHVEINQHLQEVPHSFSPEEVKL
eukprot:12893422-Prorocentrum_lima.AAC.1